MLSIKELLGHYELKDLPKDHQDNITHLLDLVNKVRTAYDKPMTVSSGYRSMEDHLRIYKDKGVTDPSKIPMQSRHLSGRAVDILDGKHELQTWCKDNVKKLEEIGLWMEDFSATPNWCHFQSVAPKSGKRFFLP